MKKLRLDLTIEELGFITEAMEMFFNAVADEGCPERDDVEKLFIRVAEKNRIASGEPEEGY